MYARIAITLALAATLAVWAPLAPAVPATGAKPPATAAAREDRVYVAMNKSVPSLVARDGLSAPAVAPSAALPREPLASPGSGPPPVAAAFQPFDEMSLREMHALHAGYLDEFARRPGFGNERMVLRQFPAREVTLPLPALSADPNMAAERQRWFVQNVQLVGLFVHDEPVVYETYETHNRAHVPRMPTRAPTELRDPDDFERGALLSIQAGETLVAKRRGDSLRMLGAIRARAGCVICHDVEQGHLLGAFSYVFDSNPAPEARFGEQRSLQDMLQGLRTR